jgi:hypothetical protein
MQTIVYRLFGLPIWSVTRTIDEESVYRLMSQRFKAEMEDALKRVRAGGN